MAKCFFVGHDWVVIDKLYTAECVIPRTKAVCLRCRKIQDNITPYLQYEEREKQKKKSRLEQAKDIYRDRANPNVD
jgi:hypothetical protein